MIHNTCKVFQILSISEGSVFQVILMLPLFKVSKGAKIRNRYNQVPHPTQDTNGKVTNSQQTPQTRAKRPAPPPPPPPSR